MDLEVDIVASDRSMPTVSRVGDAGMDLRSVDAHRLAPGGRTLVPTGVRLAIPEGYVGLVLPRSGLALAHGVTVLNAPGCIDSGYRGEVGVVLINLGEEPYLVEDGERVAQLIVCQVATVRWSQVFSLPQSARDSGGFGSTGRL